MKNGSVYVGLYNMTNLTAWDNEMTLGANGSLLAFEDDMAESEGETLTFKITKLFLYAVIFLISVVGNSLVCWSVYNRRKLRNVTNTFIMNLAISDLAVTCICIPFDIPVQEMNYEWPYGAFMCKILWPLQTVTTFSSVFTLTCLAFTRYWAIVYPMKRQLSIKKARVCIGFVWILSAICLIPYVMVLGLDEATLECGETWPGPEYRRSYTLFLFIAQYVIPIFVITIVYTRIGYELYCSPLATSNSALKQTQVDEARKVVRMLVIVTLIFAVCVLPNNVAWIWLDFGNALEEFPKFWDFVAITNIILFANCAANPVCYTMCNQSFRDEFGTYLMICLTRSRIRNYQQDIMKRRRSSTTMFSSTTRRGSSTGIPSNWRIVAKKDAMNNVEPVKNGPSEEDAMLKNRAIDVCNGAEEENVKKETQSKETEISDPCDDPPRYEQIMHERWYGTAV